MSETGSAPQNLEAIAARFEVATAKLLTRRALLRRIDTKFLLDHAALGAVLEQLGDDYGVLLANGRALSSYRTLYFDDPDLRFFHDHRRGRRPRQKVRIRHYDDRDLSFAEIKTKRSEVLTIKHRQPIAFNSDELDADAKVMLAEHCGVPAAALRPQLWTNFRRMTLVGLRTAERVTIDVDLDFARDDNQLDAGAAVILEVKQWPRSVQTPIWQALRRRMLRPVSVSKYCAATVLLSAGAIRYNRLKPSLRAMAEVA